MQLIHCFLVIIYETIKIYIKKVLKYYLFLVYLKNSGISIRDHPLMNELVFLKKFISFNLRINHF
jgi:hypothetical protein